MDRSRADSAQFMRDYASPLCQDVHHWLQLVCDCTNAQAWSISAVAPIHSSTSSSSLRHHRFLAVNPPTGEPAFATHWNRVNHKDLTGPNGDKPWTIRFLDGCKPRMPQSVIGCSTVHVIKGCHEAPGLYDASAIIKFVGSGVCLPRGLDENLFTDPRTIDEELLVACNGSCRVHKVPILSSAASAAAAPPTLRSA